MTVNTQKDGRKLTVIAEGKLGTTAAPQLEKAVKDNISGVTELVFDFGKLEYLASAGLRVLLSAGKAMKKHLQPFPYTEILEIYENGTDDRVKDSVIHFELSDGQQAVLPTKQMIGVGKLWDNDMYYCLTKVYGVYDLNPRRDVYDDGENDH